MFKFGLGSLRRLKAEVREHSPRELHELTDLAERRLSGAGARLRANLIPPLLRDATSYDRRNLRSDLLAGLTIATLTVPQSVAFALLIGIPVSAVLAASIVGTVICALYGSSHHLVFGPSNTLSLILASALVTLAADPLTPLQKVLLIGFLMGAIQLAAGLTDLGRFTQFVSRSVIVAYTTAAGILISFGQIENLTGLAAGSDPSLPGKLHHLATSALLLSFNRPTALVGLACLAAILWLRRWRPRWPDGLPVLALAGIAAYALGLDQYGVRLVRDLGSISDGVPFFSGFPLNAEGLALLPKVTSLALAAAILGILEAVTIAKSLAARSGQHLDPNQELIGMGLGNLLGAGFGAMPGSASFLRSSTALQAGGRSQWAVVTSSVAVLLIVLVLAPFIGYVPVAAIAAYLFIIALRLIHWDQIRVVRCATSSDALVFWITLIAALFLELDTAIFTGIGVSLVLFLKKASAPTLVEHAFNDQGRLTRIDEPNRRNHPQVSIIHVEGDLFFGAADLFQDAIHKLAADPQIRIFVLRLKNARHLDATTVMAIGQLHDYLRGQDRHLLVSGVQPDIAAVLERSGLAAQLGAENIFRAELNPTLATKRALQRAQQILGLRPELRIFYQQTPAHEPGATT